MQHYHNYWLNLMATISEYDDLAYIFFVCLAKFKGIILDIFLQLHVLISFCPSTFHEFLYVHV